jgi:glycosyltransferase involved in cell wall biosynthesis
VLFKRAALKIREIYICTEKNLMTNQIVNTQNIDVSIIGPAMNESGNIDEFVERCITGFKKAKVNGEIIIIDDGSSDGTRQVLIKQVECNPGLVRGFFHRRNMGLTQALKTGFQNSRGKYIIWISPDLEAHPDEDIPIFVSGFREGADVVAGARLERGDGKGFASKIYNIFCEKLFGLQLRDMNWTKGFRRECVDYLELRGDWHRFILVMLHLAGFKIIEKDVRWYSRKYGYSKFGILRFPRSMIDAISVWFMLFFSQRPMRLFGAIGGLTGIAGLLIHLYLILLYVSNGEQIRPLFWGASFLLLFALQMLILGFISELIERVRDDMESLQNKLGLSRKLARELDLSTLNRETDIVEVKRESH